MKLTLCFLALIVAATHQQLNDPRTNKFPWSLRVQQEFDDGDYYPAQNRFDEYPLGRFYNPFFLPALNIVDVSRQ